MVEGRAGFRRYTVPGRESGDRPLQKQRRTEDHSQVDAAPAPALPFWDKQRRGKAARTAAVQSGLRLQRSKSGSFGKVAKQSMPQDDRTWWGAR